MNPEPRTQESHAHNLVLVDDYPVFRKDRHLLLKEEEDRQVIGEAGDSQTAIDRVRELSPDVVVMDITTPNFNGINVTRQIKTLQRERDCFLWKN